MAQKIVDLDGAKPLGEQVKDLQIPPQTLIILIGDADAQFNPQIRSICSRVLARLALSQDALVLDDPTTISASLMGSACADQDRMTTLVGVVPKSTAGDAIEANHEIVFRLPAGWTDVYKGLYQIADVLSDAGEMPVATILFGGGADAQKAVMRCATRKWPVVAVQGSGGLADALLDAIAKASEGPPKDPDLRQMVEEAIIIAFPLAGSMDDLEALLLRNFERRAGAARQAMLDAWQRFDEIDMAARVKQEQFRTLELWLSGLAVSAALLAILSATNAIGVYSRYLPVRTIAILIIVTPIVISIVTAYNGHFRDGNKWVILRGSAEALKREIFRFRAKSGAYSYQQCLQTTRELKLAAARKDIDSALAQSEVNKTSVPPQPAGDSARATFLSPDQYIQERIHNQMKYFQDRIAAKAQRLLLLQWLIWLAGGAGTFLAAIKLSLWVALTTAIATALGNKLQSDQVENSLIQYNQALASLRNIEAWWLALTGWEQSRRKNIDLLVEQTEKTLEAETAGWVQQMRSTLDKLTEKEPEKAASPKA